MLKPFDTLVILMALYGALAIARLSLGVGIIINVSCLFVLVGYFARIDPKSTKTYSVIRDFLPLALIFALMILVCWFVFRILFSLQNDDPQNILKFWFDWQVLNSEWLEKPVRIMASWLYAPAWVALIFIWLMLSSFASWFSYPLMVFQQKRWSEAREMGRNAYRQHAGVMYQISALIIAGALLSITVLQVFIPFFYLFFAALMYVSYQQLEFSRN